MTERRGISAVKGKDRCKCGGLKEKRAKLCRTCRHTARRKDAPTFCSVRNCRRPHAARGLCNSHWRRWRNGLPMDPPIREVIPGRVCSVDGCGRPHISHGFCKMHLQRWERKGEAGQAAPLERARGRCSVNGCQAPHAARGFCDKHYRRWKSHGDPLYITRAEACHPLGFSDGRAFCSHGPMYHHSGSWTCGQKGRDRRARGIRMFGQFFYVPDLEFKEFARLLRDERKRQLKEAEANG